MRQALSPLILLLLTGCAMSPTATQTPQTTVSVSAHGTVWGGNQTLGYSTIQLWAANATGYGLASTALIASVIKSDSLGAFGITSTFTCPSASTPVYITASGGNPGLPGGSAVSNPAIVMMAALGPCGALSGSTHITLNEATTVAAIASLAQFFTTWDHLGTSSTNAAGLANSMSMSNNLVSYDTGQSGASMQTYMTVPTAEIYTLANILASCVNTDGNGSACTSLFAAATPPGGTAPTNVADAMINIAKYPGNNISALFNLSTASVPFQPTLSSAPNDWTIAVNLGMNSISNIRGLAFDVDGNAFQVDQNAVRKYSPAGALLSSSLGGGYSITVNTDGNVWVGTNSSFLKYDSALAASTTYNFFGSTGGQLGPIVFTATGDMLSSCANCTTTYKIVPTQSPVTYSTFYNSPYPYARSLNIANNGDLWVGLSYSNYISATDSTGTVLPGFPKACNLCGSGNNNGQKQIASDSSSNAWIAGYNLSRMTPSGTLTTFDSIAAGIFYANALAVDGNGAAWVSSTAIYPNPGTPVGVLGAYNNDGTARTGATGYQSSTLAAPNGVTLDRSGNIWITNQTTPSFTIFLGLAAPVITPTASAVAASKVGLKP